MELLANVGATIRYPEPGGDPVAFDDPPKVTIIRDSTGTDVLTDVVATEVIEGEGEEAEEYWTVKIPAADLAELDLLTAQWVGEIDGDAATFETEYEVVGGFVISLAEIRRNLNKEIAAKITDADIAAKRERAVREIEQECGTSFRLRYSRERLDGRGYRRLILGCRGLKRIISVEVEGRIWSPTEVEALSLDPSGVIEASSPWPRGIGNVVVTYVAGLTSYPSALEPICAYALYLLTPTPTDVNQRATSMTVDDATYRMVTPGERGARFPLPSVNAFVAEFDQPLFA